MTTTTLSTVAPTAAATCCAPLSSAGLSDDEAAATAKLFKALSDPHRVRIVNMLSNSDEAICVCDLTDPLGLAQPTVSHHLKKLLDAGLIHREQRGTWSYYSLNTNAMARLRDVVALGGAQ